MSGHCLRCAHEVLVSALCKSSSAAALQSTLSGYVHNKSNLHIRTSRIILCVLNLACFPPAFLAGLLLQPRLPLHHPDVLRPNGLPSAPPGKRRQHVLQVAASRDILADVHLGHAVRHSRQPSAYLCQLPDCVPGDCAGKGLEESQHVLLLNMDAATAKPTEDSMLHNHTCFS